MAELNLLTPEQSAMLFNILWGAKEVRGACNPVIAGGVLRDTLLGRSVADIDVFHEGALTDTSGLVQQVVGESDYETPLAIWTLPGDVPIQFIQVGEVEDRLDMFSCALSEVFYKLDGMLQMTSAFMDSVTRQVLQFREHCSVQYKRKMIEKFPEWAVVGGPTLPEEEFML